MNIPLFEKLNKEGLISDNSLSKIKTTDQVKPFSLHWELTTILYLGVLILTGGLGVLVYKNIDTIGHQVILAFIALISGGCFFYCLKNKAPYSTSKVESPNIGFDYILLLACLTFVIFIGYLQYQYHVFGERFGLATFIPMAVLFFCAYFFDHLGVLTLAITNLCAWAGITVTPLEILRENDFSNERLIVAGIILGVGLIGAGILTRKNNFKAHFEFTYTNFGMNLLFISVLAAMFEFERLNFLWFIALTGIAFYFYKEAFRRKSFYELLMSMLYGYVGLSYMIAYFLFAVMHGDLGGLYLFCFYCIGSAVWFILFLIRMNKKIKSL
ncbi:MAG: DUF2157 domain-containing protein [Chitinophagaceae bacterium]